MFIFTSAIFRDLNRLNRNDSSDVHISMDTFSALLNSTIEPVHQRIIVVCFNQNDNLTSNDREQEQNNVIPRVR